MPNLDWCVLEQEIAAIFAELRREQQREAREDAAARSGVVGRTRGFTILRTFLVWDRPKSAPDWAGGICFYYLLLVSVATLAWTIWRLVTGRSDLAIIWFLSFMLYGASAVFLRWMYYRRQQRNAADRVAAADASTSVALGAE